MHYNYYEHHGMKLKFSFIKHKFIDVNYIRILLMVNYATMGFKFLVKNLT